ncbi:MAG: hypothetical protein QXX68_02900 [Candidatus Pacearchaeota archaeon]
MKKGASHIEMIIAFGIFITAIIFILLFLRPTITKNDELSESLLVSLKNNFVERASEEVVIIFINSTQPCSPYQILNGTSEQIDINKYYIIISREIMGVLPNCSSLGTSFQIGSIRRRDVMSNSSLHELKKLYESDYNLFLKNLSAPKGINFEILSENYELKRKTPTNVNILSRKYKFDILYSNGTIEKKEFILRIW